MVTRYKNKLEKFLQTERGKRLLNFAYSFGAAIVILGTMFKLLILPFADIMLAVGLITEIFVFVISAFDRPVRDYRWEEVFPVLASGNPQDRPDFTVNPQSAAQPATQSAAQPAPQPTAQPAVSYPAPQAATEMPHTDFPQADFPPHTSEYSKQMETLNRNLLGLNAVYEIQLKSISNQIGTIEQITDGLNRVKEMYGDSIPSGYSIKHETEKMAEQLRQLNQVYARMLDAMTPQAATHNP